MNEDNDLIKVRDDIKRFKLTQKEIENMPIIGIILKAIREA